MPKTGNSNAEYEDAFFPLEAGVAEADLLRYAVADGASEGILSKPWAELLAKLFCRLQPPSGDLNALLAHAEPDWRRWLKHYLAHRELQNRPVQWFEEPGLERGAFSTLLGLALRRAGETGRWRALAVGDSCLFQVRKNRLLTGFPAKSAADFNNRPFLIASNPAANQGLLERAQTAAGTWRPGDRFYLMTDALAAWFWREVEARRRPWPMLELIAREQPHTFGSWLQTLQANKQIRNDDVTLLCVEVL
jgi:hypothetical protein